MTDLASANADGGKDSKRWALRVGTVLVLLAISVYVWMYAVSRPPQQAIPLRVGYQNSPAMALIIVADHEHFFGTDVVLTEFTAGKFALQAFLGGSLDVAVAGDVPTGLALLQGQELVAFAEVLLDSRNEVRMIVRHSGGCENLTPESFFGSQRRTIATSFGGGPEYFAHDLFRHYQIPSSRYELISQRPEEMPAGLSGSNYDGIAIFDPAAAQAERLLKGSVCTLPDPGSYRQHYVAVARPDSIDGDARFQLDAFVAALRKAQEYVMEHPAESQQIVSGKTGIAPEILREMWPNYSFGVTLDPGLASLWRAQAEWQRTKSNSGTQFADPDYEVAINAKVLNAK